ncbi:MAG: cytochrome c nitrite reductase small subunit [Ignavibacteriae bacterium]|nr:cytochrome c nitrite reductase small subunit [Ignavibacteriota bacterium]
MKIFKRAQGIIAPPENWKLPVIIITGILIGLAFLVFHIGKGTSYLSDDPETCVNCHVMFPQYSSWQHSSHARTVSCNDCHVPHNNIFSKYLFKASDGLRHSTMFTLRLEPQVIRIKQAGKDVVQKNCERCHTSLLSYSHSAQNGGNYLVSGETYCWKCHEEIPHGTVNSLSAFPFSRVPKLSKPVPEWIENLLIQNK